MQLAPFIQDNIAFNRLMLAWECPVLFLAHHPPPLPKKSGPSCGRAAVDRLRSRSTGKDLPLGTGAGPGLGAILQEHAHTSLATQVVSVNPPMSGRAECDFLKTSQKPTTPF